MEEQNSILSEQELLVINKLVEAWDEFIKLETLHPDEQTDFRKAIHEAQRNVMARPARKEVRQIIREKRNKEWRKSLNEDTNEIS